MRNREYQLLLWLLTAAVTLYMLLVRKATLYLFIQLTEYTKMCFCSRFRAIWKTPSSTSTRRRISRSNNTWRWAPSWPRRPARATACRIPMPRASRWPAYQSWGTDTWPLWATAATPTARLPCWLWPVTTARWGKKKAQTNNDVDKFMELKLKMLRLSRKLKTVAHHFCRFSKLLSMLFFPFTVKNLFSELPVRGVLSEFLQIKRWIMANTLQRTCSHFNESIASNQNRAVPINHPNKVMPLLISLSPWYAHQ